MPKHKSPPLIKNSVIAYVALGSNMGDRLSYLQQAVKTLDAHDDIELLSVSSVYRTEPVDVLDESASDFYNAVVKLCTSLSALELLHTLQEIERNAGRIRLYPNAPRTLDLDILLYDSCEINNTELTVPHPRMWQRAFVLYPLQDVAPQLLNSDLLQAVANQSCHLMENVTLMSHI